MPPGGSILAVKSSITGPGFPAGRRRSPTMVRMNSMRKACYASAAALLLGASPLVLALPAAADPCGPAGLLPAKFCPTPPTPGPPSASLSPSTTVPGSSAPPPSGSAPPQAPPRKPSATPSQGQPTKPAQLPAPPTSDPVPTADQDNTPSPATASVSAITTATSAPPATDGGRDPGRSAEQLPGAAAGRGDSGPDGQLSVAGSLLALSGLLIGLSAAIGLRRPTQP
ncbi:hypothetical protein M2428_000472 [Arthrobacter sp. ES3-54]|nr:hypothetical protein [Arthrobacter sp. ES3-54]